MKKVEVNLKSGKTVNVYPAEAKMLEREGLTKPEAKQRKQTPKTKEDKTLKNTK
jgi:hypothetical protein